MTVRSSAPYLFMGVAAVLFTGKLVQSEGFKCGAELGCQDSDFGYRIIVKAGVGRTLQECNGTNYFP